MITIPTLAQLYTSIKADLESELGITIPLVGKSVIRAIAAVQAAKIKLLYLGLGLLQKNIFIDTADPEASGGTLERFGRVKLGRDPFPATSGEYDVEVTGLVGAIIPAGTTFKSNDSSSAPGYLYVLDDEFELTATTDTITIRALAAGVDSALAVTDTLTATAPIANVDALATVTVISVEAQAAEDIEDYRDKALLSYRLETQGGAPSDFRLWSLDAQGVETSYPYRSPGNNGTVDLYVEATIADSIDGKGTPSPALLLEVEAVVETNPYDTLEELERGRRPIGVIQVNYLPVTPLDVDVIITGLVGGTAAIETSIENAIQEAVDLIRPFISGIDVVSEQNDIIDTNKMIGAVLVGKPGAIFTSLSLSVDGNIVSSFQFTDGDIPYLNSVTFV
jgi:uncharacterized phage protein gp47/JayE